MSRRTRWRFKMKGKMTICLAVLILILSPAVLGAGKHESKSDKIRDCLCSIHEVAIPQYYNAWPQETLTEDAKPIIHLVESLTWLKVVRGRAEDRVPRLSFGFWSGGTHVTSDSTGASVGNHVEFSLGLYDPTTKFSWDAYAHGFEGNIAVPGPYGSVRTQDVSADDLEKYGQLLLKLNKAAHGCK